LAHEPSHASRSSCVSGCGTSVYTRPWCTTSNAVDGAVGSADGRSASTSRSVMTPRSLSPPCAADEGRSK
jgi:hypothetical protein